MFSVRGQKSCRPCPAAWIVILYITAAAVLFVICGSDARIAVPDNLDLFQAQYQMLKNTDTFSSQGVDAPFLSGVTRDDLPSELQLPTVVYRLFPSLAAYELLYLLRIVLGVAFFGLLARELDQAGRFHLDKTGSSLWILCGFAYTLLPLFPAYGISFISIPLAVWILLRIDRETRWLRLLVWYALLFAYPFVSYFSYFGLFLVAYIMAAFLLVSLARRKLQPRLLIAAVILGAGFALFEYRLFRTMLFSDEVTIRSTMVVASLSLKEVAGQIRDVLLTGGSMHTQSLHRYIVLPVCAVYFLVMNTGYVRAACLSGRKKCDVKSAVPESTPSRSDRSRSAGDDLFNLTVLVILFNSVIYGFYYYEPFRSLIEHLVPPLQGWQFGRTAFFNPFLWYALFFIALQRFAAFIADHFTKRVEEEKSATAPSVPVRVLAAKALPILIAFGAAALILLSDSPYNDVYYTLHGIAKRIVTGSEDDSLTYGEFYSEELFDTIRTENDIREEWCAAYGLHPAILEYNGFRTIDGYLGFYPQEYKDRFRKAIAPALDKQPPTRQYFDDWGARCYLYSGTFSTIVEAVRSYPHPEDQADLDLQALQALGCRYIFSRPLLTNAADLGLVDAGTYTADTTPYVIHLYEVPLPD